MSTPHLNISASFNWIKKEADCSPCKACGDMIVTAKNVLTIETRAGNKTDTAETKYVLCNSCLEFFNKE